jgi:hypothetical protein
LEWHQWAGRKNIQVRRSKNWILLLGTAEEKRLMGEQVTLHPTQTTLVIPADALKSRGRV